MSSNSNLEAQTIKFEVPVELMCYKQTRIYSCTIKVSKHRHWYFQCTREKRDASRSSRFSRDKSRENEMGLARRWSLTFEQYCTWTFTVCLKKCYEFRSQEKSSRNERYFNRLRFSQLMKHIPGRKTDGHLYSFSPYQGFPQLTVRHYHQAKYNQTNTQMSNGIYL